MTPVSHHEASKDYIAAQSTRGHYKLRLASDVATLFQDGAGGSSIYPPLRTQKRWTLCWTRQAVAGLGDRIFGVTPVTVMKGKPENGCVAFQLPEVLNEMRAQGSWQKTGATAHRELEHDLDRIALANGLRLQLE